MKTSGKNISKMFLLFLFIVSLECIFPASGLSENHQINGTDSLLSPVLRGEPYNFHGNIPANPSHEIQLWVFGKKYVTFNQIPVTDDNSFNWSLETRNLSSGRYYIFVQDSGNDGKFDIVWVNKSDDVVNLKRNNGNLVIYTLADAQNMYNYGAVTVLLHEFNSTGVDDSISVYSLEIIEPYITINPVGDYTKGDLINITGTTNFPVKTTLRIAAEPRIFTNNPINGFLGQSTVIQGTESNLWSISVNTSTFSIGEYSIQASPLNDNPIFNYTAFNVTPRHIIPHTTPANISPTVTEETRVLVQNQTVSLGSTTLPTPKPAAFPAIIPVIVIGCVIIVGIGRKRQRMIRDF